MSEELDDGAFWLPPQFLTDDDIIMDFSDKGGLDFGSDPDSFSGTGSDRITESDEDELLSVLTRQMARCSIGVCDVHSKGWVLSSSPKSTLCGCMGKEGSSLGSPKRPVSPPSAAEKATDAATWNLLNEAAGEVARVKMRRENTAAVTGTGFFDCSLNGQFRNSPSTKTTAANNHRLFYHKPPFYQGLVWGQVKAANGPLSLPLSAWPPLQDQNHHQNHQHHQHALAPVFMGQPQPGPKRECAGTGVFLPRQVHPQTETRRKTDLNGTKSRSGKRQSQQRKSSRPPMAKQGEIKLPQEWTY